MTNSEQGQQWPRVAPNVLSPAGMLILLSLAIASPVRAQTAETILSDAKACFSAVYNAPEAASLRRHYPADVREANLAQLSDRSLPTPAELSAIQLLHPRQKACQQALIFKLQVVSPSAAAEMARGFAQNDDDLILFMQRRMTWGERVRRGRDRVLAAQAALSSQQQQAQDKKSRDAYECQGDAQRALAQDPRTAAALDPEYGRNQGLFGALAKTIVGSGARQNAEATFAACMRARGWR